MCLSVFNKENINKFLLILLTSVFLVFLSSYNFRTFLFLVDITELIIGFTILIIAMNTRNISQNNLLILFAIMFAFSNLINLFLIIISYSNDSVLFSNYYLYLQAFSDFLKILSFLLIPKFYSNGNNFNIVTFTYFFITSIFMLSLFVFNILPDIRISLWNSFSLHELILVVKFVFSLFPIYVLHKSRSVFSLKDRNNLLYTSISFSIALFLFNFYSIHFLLKFIAHMTILLHVYIIYKIMVAGVLIDPYNLLFCNLNNKTKELISINNKLQSKNIQLQRMQDKLKSSKDRYKNLVESLPDSLIIRQGKDIVFSNSNSLKLFKAPLDSDFKGVDINSLISRKYIDIFKSYSRHFGKSFEAKLKALNGIYFDAEVTQIPIVFNNSSCILTLIKDISEKKKLYDLKLKLRQKIEEDKMRTEFFSTISHELRTPINVIYSTLQLEDIHIKNGNLDALINHHHVIKQNCFRLLRLSNNLIDITKIDSGYFNPEMKCLNIVSVVENIVLSVSSYIENKNMSITFDTEVEESYILCDCDLMERVILNLISNSIKYGNSNGNIFVNMYDEKENIKIIFKDDGPGIAKSKCDNIFEKFIQVDKSLTRKCEGSGIGLSLVKSIVELLGGNISLESDEGKGCEFTIILPKALDICIDEIAVSNDIEPDTNATIDRVSIEFSDIYL